MIQKEFEKPVAALVQKLSKNPNVFYIYLFGSVARGEASSRHSDIDILIITEKEQDLDKEVGRLSLELDMQIAPITFSLNDLSGLESGDRTLVREVLENGILLYQKKGIDEFPPVPTERLGLRPWFIVKYSTKGLSNTPNFLAYLFGKKSYYYKAGKRMVTDYGSVLEKVSGKKIGKGVIIVPKDQVEKIRDFLKSHGVEFDETVVWM